MTITWWGRERTNSRAVNTVHYKFRFVLIMLQREMKEKNEDEKEELVNQVIAVFRYSRTNFSCKVHFYTY